MKLSPLWRFNLSMKHLHRLALIALVAATSLGTAAAQTATTPPPPPQDAPPPPPPDGKDRGARRLKEMADLLKLTPAQQDQVKAILADSMKQSKAVLDDKSLSEEDRRGKMKDIREATHEKIRALLTADQQKTFDEMKEHEHHRPPPDGQTPPPPQS